jgi:hypothetical protein
LNLLAVWKRYGQRWLFSVQTSTNLSISLADDTKHGALKQVVVSSVDRTGQESPRSSYSKTD